jgi:hypothetical protein
VASRQIAGVGVRGVVNVEKYLYSLIFNIYCLMLKTCIIRFRGLMVKALVFGPEHQRLGVRIAPESNTHVWVRSDPFFGNFLGVSSILSRAFSAMSVDNRQRPCPACSSGLNSFHWHRVEIWSSTGLDTFNYPTAFH